MNALKTLTVALMFSGSAAALAADTVTQVRLNEVLKTDAQYQEAWIDLLEDQERLPDWLINLDGVASPMEAMIEDDDKYLVGDLCQENKCFNQRIYVAFSWDKEDAYALYVQLPEALPQGKAPSEFATIKWLGEPDEGMQKLLREQLKKDPNWY